MKSFSLLLRLLFLAFLVSGFKIQEDHHQNQQQLSTTAQNLHSIGVNKDKHGSGWKEVPVQDPVVRDAADYAVKTIQQRSNSLFPYKLQQIVQAKSQAVEDSVKFEMVLKLENGGKEEKFKVEVVKNNQGSFHLNHMEKIN